jgi:hypothetical protein
MSGSPYPCQPYSSRLDAVDAALSVVGNSFQPAFSNNTNGLQRFQVLANGGDGYATFDFRSEHTPSSSPEVSLRINADEGFNVQHGSSFLSATRNAVSMQRGGRFLQLNDSGYLVSDPANFRTAIDGASLADNTFTGLQQFSGTNTPGLQLKSLTDAQITALATASALPNGSLLVSSTTNRARIRLNGVTEEVITTAGGQTINGALTVGTQLTSGSSSSDTRAVFQSNNSLAYAVSRGTGRYYLGASANTTTPDLVFSNNAGTERLRLSDAGNLTASGTLAGQILSLSGPDVANTIQTTASGGITFSRAGAAGSWIAPSDGRYQMRSDGYIGITSGTNPISGLAVTLSMLNTTTWRMGVSGLNSNADLALANLTASGTVTATGTGTHTFGTTNTVTMAAGVISAVSATIANNATRSSNLVSMSSAFNIGNGNSVLSIGYTGADMGRALSVSSASFTTGAMTIAQTTSANASNTNVSGLSVTGTFQHTDAGGATSIGNGGRFVATNTTASSGTLFGLDVSATTNAANVTGLRVTAATTSGTALAIDAVGSIQTSGTLGWSDVRMPRIVKTLQTQCFESTLSAWQETSRQEASATGARWSCLGATPIVRQTLPAAATDAATTQALANSIRSLLINFGFAN